MKRSLVVDATGIPLGVISARANDRDSPLLAPTLDTLAGIGPLPEHVQIHLDAGYDSGKTRAELASRAFTGVIAHKGEAAPLQVGGRWPVERTNAWHNHYRKLLICTERRKRVVDFWISFANALIMTGRLIREAWIRHAGTTDHAEPPDLLAQPLSHFKGEPVDLISRRRLAGRVLAVSCRLGSAAVEMASPRWRRAGQTPPSPSRVRAMCAPPLIAPGLNPQVPSALTAPHPRERKANRPPGESARVGVTKLLTRSTTTW
jgi:hypothetical protein